MVEIEEKTGIITEIAEKTDLLAINAAKIINEISTKSVKTAT